MQEAKVQFSTAEMELMCNMEVILTKNMVMEKVKRLLQQVQEEMLLYYEINRDLLPMDIFSIHSKISKGENYLGLPYLILDYPRVFKQKDIFTVRTMFWWGKFYSTTLHVAGAFKSEFIEKITSVYELLANRSYYIGVNPEPWAHHFDEDNYRKIALLTNEKFKNACKVHDHLKIATNISITDPGLENTLVNNWKELISVCFD